MDGIVEGTVLRSGDRIRIASQLIYAPLDQHLWAHSYEREVSDVLPSRGRLHTRLQVQSAWRLPQTKAHGSQTGGPWTQQSTKTIYAADLR